MYTEYNEEKQGESLKKAIEHADSAAGNDDVAFVKSLRSKFFEEQSMITGAQRGTSNRRRIQANKNPPVSILLDPRFARNARELTRTTDRILLGTRVRDKTFHDCVAIESDCGGCTGTLIAKNIVVTAAHCECNNGNVSRVFVGNDVDEENEGKWINVAKQVPHPQYSDHSDKNDLMVLVLESGITDVPPRKIAPSEMIDKATNARAVGFGNTDPNGDFGYGIKRQVDLPIASNSCQGNTKGIDDQESYACHPGMELVAGRPWLGMNTCTGDSGGPLYISDGQGGWLLACATSRGTPGNPHRCGDGGVYVRLDQYLDWIRSIANI